MFRIEAVDHQRQRFHGTVVLARPWSFGAITALLTLLVAALLVFAWKAGFTRKEVVTGIVVPDRGVIRLVAPQAGRVQEVKAVAGQAVKAGDALFVVRDERVASTGASRGDISRSLADRLQRLESEARQQEELATLRQRDLRARASHLEASLRQLAEERRIQQERANVLSRVAEGQAQLAREGMVSPLLAEAKRAEALEEQARLARLDRNRLDTEGELAAVQAQRGEAPVQAEREQSSLRRELAALRQQMDESDLQREVVVHAPDDGVLAAVLVEPGQALDAAAELAHLVPKGAQLVAELMMPSRAAGQVQPGQAVQLRFEAYPYEQFGLVPGRVSSVSLSPVATAERTAGLVSPTTGGAAAVYRARVDIDMATLRERTGQAVPLRPGMLLQASIALEHRTLIEWALAPLLGVGRSL
ncbi:HlyD family secretion protein [Ideonella sp. YS5]|uniref:HlyD family secretion protein n=1 Tax=Ideonella sp. YS5 TaxID=3453714 RepID=UPI003EE86A5F